MAKNKSLYEIIYEDKDIVIVNKNSDILSIPDRFREDIPNLYKALQDKYPEVYIVHRLDKGTSGLICFALNKESHRKLSKQFEARAPHKTYWALVEGVFSNKEGEIDAPITQHPTKLGTMCIHKRGKDSLSNYKVIEEFKEFSLVEVQILTGRTHQIRVHMQHIGHPLVVDEVYGLRTEFFLSEIKRRKFNLKKYTEERPLLNRAPLHAYALSFKHPSSNEACSFTVDPPKDMMATIKQLRKWNS